jgi:hypothetical protein
MFIGVRFSVWGSVSLLVQGYNIKRVIYSNIILINCIVSNTILINKNIVAAAHLALSVVTRARNERLALISDLPYTNYRCQMHHNLKLWGDQRK